MAKRCPDCGERVYALGCVNCDEGAYIEAQAAEDGYEPDREYADIVDSGSPGDPRLERDR